jgi:hypothetical protein
MSRAMSSQHISSAGGSSAGHEILFKTDRPRAIDRFIDYFGGDSKAEDEDRSVAEPVTDIGDYLAG